jgi:8-oxo-dGTP diphosphatase
MNKRKEFATKASWSKAQPFPIQYVTLALDLKLNNIQSERLKQGFIPSSMDERWFSYYENNTLYQYRSWTGTCIYQIHFVEEVGCLRATHAEVNRDTSEYSNRDDNEDKKTMEELVIEISNFKPGTQSEYISIFI